LAQYVNDRPYAASSMLAVALGRVFGSALRGECKTRPELLDVAPPLEIHGAAVPCWTAQSTTGLLATKWTS
jgi:hypothetical protein